LEGYVPDASEFRNSDHAEDENIDDTGGLLPQFTAGTVQAAVTVARIVHSQRKGI
jgi:hypothetical protein